jgi:hypothetical protein
MITHETDSDPKLQQLFSSLWNDFTSFNPQAKRIYDLFLAREKAADPQVTSLVNDHIALRTFDCASIGLSTLSALFERHGYQEKGEYFFKEKKLYARHLEHRNVDLPRVFISELETEKFTPELRATCTEIAKRFQKEDLEQESVLWSGRSWAASYARYQQLLVESEYAAWVYAFGFRCNHFTLSLNTLKTFENLQALNKFIQAHSYQLNSAGGEIKGTPADYLEQSSTLAETARVQFSEGIFEIPSCYYEFARRYPMPDGNLYQGFVAASADKIFESTNTRRS